MPRTHRKGERAIKQTQEIAEGPLRTCVVERVEKPINKLLRFVLDPDMIVTPDLKGKLPGRGVWVTANRETIDLAVKKALFSRGFKQNAKTDDKLSERVEKLLETAALQSLSLAQKSGLVSTGLKTVLASLNDRKLKALLFACDGSQGSIAKVKAKLRHQDRVAKISLYENLRSEQLGLAFGRVNVIYAALKQGGITRLCLENIQRLEDFQSTTKH